jgi:hypothetical protein
MPDPLLDRDFYGKLRDVIEEIVEGTIDVLDDFGFGAIVRNGDSHGVWCPECMECGVSGREITIAGFCGGDLIEA